MSLEIVYFLNLNSHFTRILDLGLYDKQNFLYKTDSSEAFHLNKVVFILVSISSFKVCFKVLTGHSSEGHLGSGMKVLQISLNFCQFLSIRQVFPENFSSISLTVQFLLKRLHNT